MRTHEIKLDKEFCDVVLSGEKNFEIRKNDRGYQKGDMIRFIPTDGRRLQSDSEYIELFHHPISSKLYIITYVLSGWGIKEGYVALGITEVIGHEG